MGIQSFHDDDLKFLTRIHTASEAKQCVLDSYAAGFKNVSFDLIFSLPHHRYSDGNQFWTKLWNFKPAHISCYSLIVEPGTPLYTMVQLNQVTPLDSEH